MLLRSATDSDLEGVDRLLAETFWQANDSLFKHVSNDVRARIQRELRRTSREPTAGLLVALDDEHVVGMVFLHTREDQRPSLLAVLRAVRPLGALTALSFVFKVVRRYRPAPREVYLEGLAVAATHRRQGFAERLLIMAEEQARARGKSLLTGFVARDNTASLRTFGKRGFAQQPLRGSADYVKVVKPL